MAPNPRIMKALNAMNALGIPVKTVQTVLKTVWMEYDKNWELIEADNYHALADAIFEYEEKKLKEGKRKDAMGHAESEPSSKRLHSEECDDQVSSTMDDPRPILSLGEGKTPSNVSRENFLDSSQLFLRDGGSDNSSQLPRIDKGKDPISSHVAGRVSLEVSSNENNSMKSLVSENVKANKKDEGSTCSCCTSCMGSRDLASSVLGKVKICLNCKSALGQPNFQIPNLDAVLNFVENKYLRSYKIVGPQFSVKKLLKDLCAAYWEMGMDSGNRSVIEKSSPSRRVGANGGAFKINRSEMNTSKNEATCSGSSKLCSMEAFQRQNGRQPHSPICDITKGFEKVKISLVDETGNELMPNFIYISHNIVYQDAHVHISLARFADEDCCSSCLGDCLSSAIPCACARETGGEFAYTPQGLLKEEFLRTCILMKQKPQNHHFFYCQDCPLERYKNENMPEPCKGHLVRKFIKECWRKCGCHLECGNRVVQRGINCKLQVFLTDNGKGWGLRTLEELQAGTFVCEYVGEILTNTELYERNVHSSGNERHTYPVLLDADWSSEGVLKDDEALCLDATFYGNVARFINHRCYDANLLEIPVEVETPDHHYYHIAFFTQRKVKAMEELTWDYGIDFSDSSHPIKAFECCCGSAFCRDMNRKC